jgi:hypothetical protein
MSDVLHNFFVQFVHRTGGDAITERGYEKKKREGTSKQAGRVSQENTTPPQEKRKEGNL